MPEVKEKFRVRPVTQTYQQRTATRVFRVKLDTIDNSGGLLALEAAQGPVRVPQIGELHPLDSLLVCVKKSAKSASESDIEVYEWEVECEYSNQTTFQGFPAGIQSIPPRENLRPENREPSYSFGSVFVSEPVQIPGNASGSVAPTIPTNSVGDLFDPQPMVNLELLTLDVSRYENITGTQLQEKIIKYKDSVNSDPFFGWSKNQVSISIKADSEYVSGVFMWRVNYHLEFKKGLRFNSVLWTGWQPAAFDMGFRYIDPASTEPAPNNKKVFQDKFTTGQVTRTPTLGFLKDGRALNGDGTLVGDGSGEKPKVLKWDRYEHRDFRDLLLFSTGPGE